MDDNKNIPMEDEEVTIMTMNATRNSLSCWIWWTTRTSSTLSFSR